MKILAVDFSSSRRSVAVLAGNSIAQVVETGGVGVPAFCMIKTALREAGLDRGQIECVAVGLGPGSYVGIRGAIALAQGWQLACGARLLGVSSADCIAAQAATDGLQGRVMVLIEAQREELYTATYDLDGSGARELFPLRLVARASARALPQEPTTLIGPEVRNRFPEGVEVFPQAAALAKLASTRTEFVSGETLEPIYLRQTAFVKAAPPRKLPV